MSKKKNNNKKNGKVETPQITLKDCLTKLDFEEIRIIYNLYKEEIYIEKNLPELSTKEEIVKFLTEHLPKYFNEYISNVALTEEQVQALEAGKTTTINNMWLALGFMYQEKDNNDTFIIPEEFTRNYKSTQEENSTTNFSKLDYVFRLYCFINGIITYSFLKNIVKYHNIKINEEGLKKFIKDQNLIISNNDYIIPQDEDFKELIEEKKETPFPTFELNQLYDYFSNMLMFIDQIKKVLKINDSEASNLIIPLCFSKPSSPEIIVEEIKKIHKTTNKQNKELLNIINKYESDFRYWVFNGRTYDEYINDNVINKFILTNKPQNTNLKNCLGALSEDAKKILKDCYNASGEEELINGIEDSFNEFVYFFDRDFAQKLINNQDIDFAEYIDIEDIVHGYFFIYKENEQIKYIVPKEIQKIFKSIDLKDLENICECEECTSDILISNYLRMNGIIENKELQSLLKTNHDINLTITELDKIITQEYYIILDKYYTPIFDLEEKEAQNLIATKKEYGKYKVFDHNVEDNDELFDYEINELLDHEINIDDNIKNELYSGIIFLVKMALYSDDNLSQIINEIKANITTKEQKKIEKVIKKYKDKISVWTLNGYSIKEYQKDVDTKDKQ